MKQGRHARNAPESEHQYETVIFNGYGLGRVCKGCGKQILDDNEDPGDY